MASQPLVRARSATTGAIAWTVATDAVAPATTNGDEASRQASDPGVEPDSRAATLGTTSERIERVFPMRSVVNVRPKFDRSFSTQHNFPTSRKSFRSPPTSPRVSQPADAARNPLTHFSPTSPPSPQSHAFASPKDQPLLTGDSTQSAPSSPSYFSPLARRFGKPVAEPAEELADASPAIVMGSERVVTDEGEIWVATGPIGEQDEGRHCLGGVQGYACLVVLEEDGAGNFVVQQVSENSTRILGVTPNTLFASPTFTAFLDLDSTDRFLDAQEALDDTAFANTSESDLELPLDAEDSPKRPSTTLLPPEYFQIKLRSRDDRSPPPRLYASLHRPSPLERPSHSILELELVDDTENPLSRPWTVPLADDDDHDVNEGRTTPRPDHDASALLKSTLGVIKPLKALGRRRRTDADLSQVNMAALVYQIEEKLRKAQSLNTFLSVTAGIFAEITNFPRALMYQFDDDWNARVVAEQTDPARTDQPSCYDLTFPPDEFSVASLRSCRVSMLYDCDAPVARMCGPSRDAVSDVVDMTRCTIRSHHPRRIQHAKHMGVRSTLTVSLFAFGQLYGFVNLAHYGPFGRRVPPSMRNLCSYLGESLSRTIERLSYQRRLQARRIINTSTQPDGPSAGIVSNGDELLELFLSDFGCLSVGEEAKLIGEVPNTQELMSILEYCRQQQFTEIQLSHEVATDFPGLAAAPTFKQIAGLLIIPLASSGSDFIFFCRLGQPQVVKWASGSPSGPMTVREEVTAGRSKPWTDETAETAHLLGLIYSRFISIWREKEQANNANSITSLLLANASHEVRTPLNAIVGYLEMAMDGSKDGSADLKNNLQKSQDASRSLIHVINDLLDLTRHESGEDLFVREPFSVRSTLEDAISLQRQEAIRKGLTVDVRETLHNTPALVVGDRTKIRRLIAWAVGNAVKYTESGSVTIEYGELPDELDEHTGATSSLASKHTVQVSISIADTGVGIPEEKLEALFAALNNVKQNSTAIAELGLGLAASARIVETLSGQMRVDSKVGVGTRFQFIIPFHLPDADQMSSKSQPRISRSSSTVSSSGSAKSRQSDIDNLISALSSSTFDRPTKGSSSSLAPGRRLGTGASRSSRPSSLEGVAAPLPINVPRVASPASTTSTLSSQPYFSSSSSPGASEARLTLPGATTTKEAVFEASPGAQLPPVRAHTQPSPAGTGWKILVVDDEKINRTIIERRLKKDGHFVTSVEHGGLAVSAFERDPTFDLILMDLNMPICDGYEATLTIRRQYDAVFARQPNLSKPASHKLNKGVPVLAVTANSQERGRSQLVDAGIDGWCLKPIRFDRLNELIRGALDAGQRAKDLYKPGEWEQGGWLSLSRSEPKRSSKA